MTRFFHKVFLCLPVILLWFFVNFAISAMNTRRGISASLLASTLQARPSPVHPSSSEESQGLQPNSESRESPLSDKQKRELLKSNFDRMKRDAKELADLAKELEDQLDKSNENVLSLGIVDKADKIEKLARKIKSTARGF